MDPLSDAKIVDSWHQNAVPWTTAVRERQIESRRLVTDQAIIDAVLSRHPGSVIDIGCGEGWLVRALGARAIRALGVDVVPALIQQAQRAGGGEFRIASYEQIAAAGLDIRADVVVCNFALLGEQSVEDLVAAVPALLNPAGSFIVQTLHPVSACGEQPYRDGWRQGSWAGFSTAFSDPAPWYFRTLESWQALFARCGLQLQETRAPHHPETQKPVSVIFIATPADGPVRESIPPVRRAGPTL